MCFALHYIGIVVSQGVTQPDAHAWSHRSSSIVGDSSGYCGKSAGLELPASAQLCIMSKNRLCELETDLQGKSQLLLSAS